MVSPVVVPQAGLEVEEGTVVAIYVEVGAHVAEGDPLLELETDKATADVVAPRAGVVREIAVAPGDVVAVGATLLVLDEGEDGGGGEEETVRVRAAPVARRAAERLGIALGDITGTGPAGRITLGDVERVAGDGDGGAAPSSAEPEASERIEPLPAVRRTVAQRMARSQQIPQFALERDVDATHLLAARDGDDSVGVSDLLVQAMAETLVRHPALAAAYVEHDGEPALRHREGIDVGLAIATDAGLLVGVLRDAHARTLPELAAERERLVAAARAGRLGLGDMTGAAITLSNLGGVGVDRFTAMLNPGETSLLAVGRPVERVVPRERGLAVVPVLTLTLTVDHRAADGAAAGAALATLATLLEGEMPWRR